jgi:alkanesulfonate monooxygenase SsuD/methylene tetrahydromethanopterin reductase-like flavin-dependent oxidoreductase (luciferase family)
LARPVPPDAVAEGRSRLAELAEARGRPTPAVTAGMLTALTGDQALPDADGLLRILTDPEGVYGMPDEVAADMLVRGGPSEIAARLARYGDAGAERVVVSIAAGDWRRQVELLAEAHALLG